MSILRADLRIRNQPPCSHPTTPPRHPRSLPLLPPILHSKQHRASTHRPGTSSPDQSQDDPRQVRLNKSPSRRSLPGTSQQTRRAALTHCQLGSLSPSLACLYTTMSSIPRRIVTSIHKRVKVLLGNMHFRVSDAKFFWKLLKQ